MGKQTESALSRKIVLALNARGHIVWKNWGSRFSLRGLADITGMSRDGRAVVLETKVAGKEETGLSADQVRFLARCRRIPGAIVAVVSSVDDAIAAIEE